MLYYLLNFISKNKRHEAKNATPGSRRLSMKRCQEKDFCAQRTLYHRYFTCETTECQEKFQRRHNMLLYFSLTTPFCRVKMSFNAGVVELADTYDLGSYVERHAGSSPVARTRKSTLRGAFLTKFALSGK